MKPYWQRRLVIHGEKEGKTLGFPTINLTPAKLTGYEEGIWACLVQVKGKEYKGVLFYGPRLIKNEKKPVLEIYILDFRGDLYGQDIEFAPFHFIRKVRNFKTVAELQKAIEEDVQKAKLLLGRTFADSQRIPDF